MVVWMRGALVAEQEAVVAVSSEVALRGATVFEGVRSYAPGAGPRAYLGLGAHLDRLMASASMLAIDHGYDPASFRRAVAAVVGAGGVGPGDDLYVRPSILVEGGRLPGDDAYRATDYVAVAPVPRTSLTRPWTAVVSTYPKPARGPLPAEAKAGGAYLAFRLPLVERVRAGADAVVVLNEHGRVAEAEGAAVCVVQGDTVVSPPCSEGCLRSITRRIVADIAAEVGARAEERPVTARELVAADAVFLAGTLCELKPLARIDDVALASDRHPLYRAIASGFDDVRAGVGPVAARWQEPLGAPDGTSDDAGGRPVAAAGGTRR
jgi:branched-chain amino acid aminotransferase